MVVLQSSSPTHQSDEDLKKVRTGLTRDILMVDDEPDLVTVLGKGLETRGFKVASYTDPTKVIEDFQPDKFDLLLTDIEMPKMNGYELYRKLHDIDSGLKVCFLTGHNEYSDEFRTFFPNMDEKCFVTKPVALGQLADRISSIIDS